MPSRYYRLDDDRELDPPSVAARCDDCGTPMTVSQETLDVLDEDEPLRCAACLHAWQQVQLSLFLFTWVPPRTGTRH